MATASPGARGIDDSREKRIPPMYDPPCPHGYVNGSCAECRRASLDAAAASEPDVGEMFERYTERHKGGQRSGWLIRRTEVTGELARLEGYARRSNAQEAELHELTSELTCLGSLIDQDDVRVRGESISRMRELVKDPANLEGPAEFPGAPALVSGLGDRRESATETLQRMRSNPWRSHDGPVNRAGTAAGLIARAHTALEGLEPQLTHDGCEKLALA